MVVNYRQFLLGVFFVLVLLTPALSVRAGCDPVCPIVIVPGMLASFDKKLMYQDIEDNKWGFVPFGNVYKALINEFKNTYHFVEGKNLFVAYYDWRKPVSENWSKYLKPKIDEAKQKSGQDKVDIVAHSMGGLLARAYIQNDRYENDVNKLVMMGTPNGGASDAYVVWEGGLFPQSWNFVYKSFFKSIQKSLGNTRNKGNLEPPLSFREFFPSIKDLLPTTPFIRDGAGLVSLDKMKDKNSFLIDLNNNADILKSRVYKIRTYAGLSGKTMAEITINPVDEQADAKFERWRDGHPIPDPPTASSTQGDETVLFASAKVSDIDNFTLEETSHVKIPDRARFTIPWFLNPPILWYLPQPFRTLAQNLLTVPTARADGDEYVAPDSMLSFTVSPHVTFELIDPDGKILSRDKNELGEENAYFDDDPEDSEDVILVTIRNPKTGKYTLKITGNVTGTYSVDSTFANASGTFDDSNEGTIKEGEEKTLEATVSDETGVALPPSDNETTTTTEEKKDNSSSSNNDSPKKKEGTVLGVATMRMKLSEVISGVRQRLEREIASAPKAPRKDRRLTKKDFNFLVGPLSEMYARAKLSEATKNKKQALKLLEEVKADYRDFANKVDQLIRAGKLNKETIKILTALVQRLGRAGLR